MPRAHTITDVLATEGAGYWTLEDRSSRPARTAARWEIAPSEAEVLAAHPGGTCALQAHRPKGGRLAEHTIRLAESGGTADPLASLAAALTSQAGAVAAILVRVESILAAQQATITTLSAQHAGSAERHAERYVTLATEYHRARAEGTIALVEAAAEAEGARADGGAAALIIEALGSDRGAALVSNGGEALRFLAAAASELAPKRRHKLAEDAAFSAAVAGDATAGDDGGA